MGLMISNMSADACIAFCYGEEEINNWTTKTIEEAKDRASFRQSDCSCEIPAG